MLLYHAFPQPSGVQSSDSLINQSQKGLAILSSILSEGLLCTKELYPVYANPNTARPKKKDFVKEHKPYYHIEQSRVCFTLLTRDELQLPIIRNAKDLNLVESHLERFGQFSVGFDPIKMRELGAVPVWYIYDEDSGNSNVMREILYRLDELRTLCGLIACIEAKSDLYDESMVPTIDYLAHLDIIPKFETTALKNISRLSTADANRFLKCVDSDRLSAANMHDFLDMVFSMIQSVDNRSFGERRLDYITEREWRIFFHQNGSLKWSSIDGRSATSHLKIPNKSATRMKKLLHSFGKENWCEQDLRNTWILHGIEDESGFHHVREFINEIVLGTDLVDSYPGILPKVKDMAKPHTIDVHVI